MQEDNTTNLEIDLGDLTSTFCLVGSVGNGMETGRVATKSGATLKPVARPWSPESLAVLIRKVWRVDERDAAGRAPQGTARKNQARSA